MLAMTWATYFSLWIPVWALSAFTGFTLGKENYTLTTRIILVIVAILVALIAAVITVLS